MSAVKLSPTMLNVLKFMHVHGGIKRLPGGFWVAPSDTQWTSGKYFSTSSVQALVGRGLAEYSEWQEGSRGNRFPIAARLTEAGASHEIR